MVVWCQATLDELDEELALGLGSDSSLSATHRTGTSDGHQLSSASIFYHLLSPISECFPPPKKSLKET